VEPRTSGHSTPLTLAAVWARAKRVRAAANYLHVAASDRQDRQTGGRTDGHPTVTYTLTAYVNN